MRVAKPTGRRRRRSPRNERRRKRSPRRRAGSARTGAKSTAGISATAEHPASPGAGVAAVVPTPFGRDLYVACTDRGVATSRFVARTRTRRGRPRERHALLDDTLEQLDAYFAKRLARFDVPLVLEGTPFAVAVWRAVGDIPVGTLASYADVARAVGRPHAHRGVASSLVHTPLALFVPAHRVVGADGTVRGAAAGSMRRRLLAFEGIRVR